jgi:hypothetical protein
MCFSAKIWVFLFILVSAILVQYGQEGFITMPIGKYEYLTENPNAWSRDTIEKFVDKYNSNLGATDEKHILNSDHFQMDRKSSDIMKNAIEEEAIYYIKNGMWPYNTYVSEYLDKNPTIIPSGFMISGVVIKHGNIAEFLSNRQVYSIFIAPKEQNKKPLPTSYKIFKGLADEPIEEETKTSMSASKI